MASNYTSTTIRLLTRYDGDLSWQREAECQRKRADGTKVYEDDLWFPTGTTGPALLQLAEAKRVCGRCPVMALCREWAIAVQEFGVAGGLDEDTRRDIRRERFGVDLPMQEAAS